MAFRVIRRCHSYLLTFLPSPLYVCIQNSKCKSAFTYVFISTEINDDGLSAVLRLLDAHGGNG